MAKVGDNIFLPCWPLSPISYNSGTSFTAALIEGYGKGYVTDAVF